MASNVKVICKRGNNVNEDYAFACEGFAYVIDGSSGITDFNVTGYESDAKWLSQGLGNALQERISNIKKGIPEIITEVIEALHSQYTTYCTVASAKNEDLPSACLSVFRTSKDKLEYFQLGDCVSLIKFKNGEIKVLFDDAVPILDHKVVSHIKAESKRQSKPIIGVLKFGKEMLIENRKKKNMNGGYWILDTTGVGISHAEVHTFDINDISQFSIMSDGFAEIVDLYRIYTYDKLILTMAEHGLEALCKELWDAQDSDPLMEKFPRLKHRDDASAVWCER